MSWVWWFVAKNDRTQSGICEWARHVNWELDEENLRILLMEEILHHRGCTKNPVNNGINYLSSTGAGFLPATVSTWVCAREMVHELPWRTPSTLHLWINFCHLPATCFFKCLVHPYRIHVWYVYIYICTVMYLHLVDFNGTCRWVYTIPHGSFLGFPKHHHS